MLRDVKKESERLLLDLIDRQLALNPEERMNFFKGPKTVLGLAPVMEILRTKDV